MRQSNLPFINATQPTKSIQVIDPCTQSSASRSREGPSSLDYRGLLDILRKESKAPQENLGETYIFCSHQRLIAIKEPVIYLAGIRYL